MKSSRRPPVPDPAARRAALARLHAASGGKPADEGEDTVRGGWIPDSLRPEHLRRTGQEPSDTSGDPPAAPERLHGPRWTLAPRHLAVIALVLVAGLTWAGCSALRSRPEPVPDANPAPVLATGSPVAAPAPTPASPNGPTRIVVHVAGKVRRPGLVTSSPGSRVAEVLTAAGGVLPGTDLTTLNLARPVTDGEQILVGAPAPPPTSTGARPPAGSASPPAQVDLNTATIDQLDDLPGVGPVLAQRILDYRTEHGRFATVDQLQEVSGVGTKKYEDLKPHVRV